MTKNEGNASIREVFVIAKNIEDKIDALNTRLSTMEGRVWVVSLLITITISALINFFTKSR